MIQLTLLPTPRVIISRQRIKSTYLANLKSDRRNREKPLPYRWVNTQCSLT